MGDRWHMKKILIVEDEVKIQEILTEFLRDSGYDIENAYEGI